MINASNAPLNLSASSPEINDIAVTDQTSTCKPKRIVRRLVSGSWQQLTNDTRSDGGRFQRQDSAFRNWITDDGRPGPTGESGFVAEAGRYHLYASLACPWAHRALIMRKLKGLEEIVSVSTVNSYMGSEGWTFEKGPQGTSDTVNGAACLHEIYTLADPQYSGPATVPVLWDKRRETIVSNESAEIMRMFNGAFDGIGAIRADFYPEPLRVEIDALNELVYTAVNNGVYRTGFATTQEAYDEAVTDLFSALDWLEQRLSVQRYLTGDAITEADWRLFTTLVRFDAVYHGHFKCNIRRISDYPALSGYIRDLYQVPGIADTVDIEQVKAHFYMSHDWINPNGIIPKGPAIDFTAPHGRDRL